MYTNPIPNLDDEITSKKVTMSFDFENPVTQAEAAESLNNMLGTAKIEPDWCHLCGPTEIRFAEKQPQKTTLLRFIDANADGCGTDVTVFVIVKRYMSNDEIDALQRKTNKILCEEEDWDFDSIIDEILDAYFDNPNDYIIISASDISL
jgi:hypothetical protein